MKKNTKSIIERQMKKLHKLHDKLTKENVSMKDINKVICEVEIKLLDAIANEAE